MKEMNQNKRTGSELAFVIVLFLVFSLSALALVTLGGKVYHGIFHKMEDNYEMRTSLSYVATKIRQNDSAEAIRVDEKTLGVPALVLSDQGDDAVYETWIYWSKGVLRELYIEQGVAFEPSDGMEIMKVTQFEIRQEKSGLIRLDSKNSSGEKQELCLMPRSAQQF